MQPQVGSIAHVHPRHYADFSQLRKHMVAADRKLKRNQTAKNVRRWECCTILPVSQVEHLLMYWPHSLLQPPGLKLHSLHSNRKPKSKLPWADMIEERMTPSLVRFDFSSRTGTWTMKTAMQTNKRTLEWYYWFEKKNLHGYNYKPHIQLLFLGDGFPIFCPQRLSSSQVQDWDAHSGVHSATKSRPHTFLTPSMWMQTVLNAHSPKDATAFRLVMSPTILNPIRPCSPRLACIWKRLPL